MYLKLVGREQELAVTVLVQKLFHSLVELYAKLECSRKEARVPGCVEPQGEVLFDKKELQRQYTAAESP